MGRFLLLLSVVWVGVSLGNPSSRVLTCVAQCEYFDAFSDTCDYASRCERVGKCVTKTLCDRFDPFDRKCQAERAITRCHQPNPYAAPPECQSFCQHFDSFEGVCTYQTRCSYSTDQRCVVETRCDRWDNFDRKCLAEIHQLTCL